MRCRICSQYQGKANEDVIKCFSVGKKIDMMIEMKIKT